MVEVCYYQPTRDTFIIKSYKSYLGEEKKEIGYENGLGHIVVDVWIVIEGKSYRIRSYSDYMRIMRKPRKKEELLRMLDRLIEQI